MNRHDRFGTRACPTSELLVATNIPCQPSHYQLLGFQRWEEDQAGEKDKSFASLFRFLLRWAAALVFGNAYRGDKEVGIIYIRIVGRKEQVGSLLTNPLKEAEASPSFIELHSCLAVFANFIRVSYYTFFIGVHAKSLFHFFNVRRTLSPYHGMFYFVISKQALNKSNKFQLKLWKGCVLHLQYIILDATY